MPLCAKIAQGVIASFYGHDFVCRGVVFHAESSSGLGLGGTRPYKKLQPIFASSDPPGDGNGVDSCTNLSWATHLREPITLCENEFAEF